MQWFSVSDKKNKKKTTVAIYSKMFTAHRRLQFKWTAFPLVCLPGAAVAFSVAAARCNGDEGGHQCQEGRHDVPQDLYSETRQCQVSWDRRPCFLRAAVNVDAQSGRARLARQRERRHNKPAKKSNTAPNIVFLSFNKFTFEMRNTHTHT